MNKKVLCAKYEVKRLHGMKSSYESVVFFLCHDGKIDFSASEKKPWRKLLWKSPYPRYVAFQILTFAKC